MPAREPDPAISHAADPVALWSKLVSRDDLTTAQRGLIIAAQHHADHIWRLAASGELQESTANGRGQVWCRLALHTYAYLRDTGAYAHLDGAHPRRCVVDPDQVRAWLSSIVEGESLAEQYGIDDGFHLRGDGMRERVLHLVGAAHSAGVLATPEHRIELWPVADEGFLLTVDAAQPPRLASHHISTRQLLPETPRGVDAALAVLSATAWQVNVLLDEQAHQLHAARSAAANAVHAAITPGQRRLPAIPDLTSPAIGGPARRPHR